MTEAQGAELIEKVGHLVEAVDKLLTLGNHLATAASWCFVAICACVFFLGWQAMNQALRGKR